ncbi:MAG: hypothetical protein WC840_04735 [Candidatus Peribacteraceae bacterium]
MERDPIDQLRAVKDYADQHKAEPACAALSELVRREIQNLLQRIRVAVKPPAEAAGFTGPEILRKTSGFQRLAGFQLSTISLGGKTELPIIEEANRLAVAGADTILAEVRAKYEATVIAAIQAAEKAATTEADDIRDAEYDEQSDEGDDDQRRMASA